MIGNSYSSLRSEAISLVKIMRTGSTHQQTITHLVLSSIIYGMKIKSSSSLDRSHRKEEENKFLDEIASDIDQLLQDCNK